MQPPSQSRRRESPERALRPVPRGSEAVSRCARSATSGWRTWGKMRAPGGKFGRKKEEAIGALLTQRNIEEAAKVAGIGANTLLRWLKVPEFQKAYREARRAAFSQSIARLQQGTSAAATTLITLLLDPNTPSSVRARVADSIFNHAIKAMYFEDLAPRVADVVR